MGRKVTDANRLSILYPRIAVEWHPSKNGILTPDDVSYGNGRKFWWICETGHEWEATINNRTNHGSGCPHCSKLNRRVTNDNRLSLKYPELAKEWHPTKNDDLTAEDVSYGSGEIVWWKCERGHEWETTIHNRSSGSGCPYCSGQFLSDDNRLSIRHPHLIEEWHPTKNGDLTPHDVSFGSSDIAWWLCERGHEWEYTIADRSRGIRCPDCPGRKVTDENRLSIQCPHLVKEWHPTKNDDLTPYDVAYRSHRKVWWFCKKNKDHADWETSVKNRTLVGSGCPTCAGKVVTDDNRLSSRYLDVSKEWHPTKNGVLTPNKVSYGANRKVWWICPKGHEWQAVVASRTLDEVGCPFCAGNIVTDDNRLSLKAPELAREWHPTRNGELTPDKVAIGTNRGVWWRCPKGHEWEAVVASRALNGNGCRYCKLTGRSRIEIYLACELATFFKDIDPTQTRKIITPEGKSLNADIAIPSEKLVIEYDGAHWHEGRLDKDAGKTERLKASGWDVLRIREEPLELVQDSDLRCQVTFGSDVKLLVDRLLIHLEEVFGIDIPGLDEYRMNESLINEATASHIIGEEISNRQKIEGPSQDIGEQLFLFSDW